MKKHVLLPLLALVITLVFATNTFGQTATIAAWNLGGFDPIPDARVQRHVRAIRNINPDVILLTEVNPDSVATDIRNQLTGYSVQILNQSAGQNIAILFKDTVAVSNVQLIPGSDDNNNRLRRALAANVRVGQFDFILIGVHMKASRPADDRTAQPTRTRQARTIANFIRRETRGVEKDVLVIGDYNMIPGEDNVNFSAMSPGRGRNEFLRYISTESLSGQTSHISRCNGNQVRGNLLDGFAISRGFTREYVARSLRIISFNDTSIFASDTGTPFNCTTYRGFVSDHFPLVATFQINRDDDR